MKNNSIKNLINENSTLLRFTCLKNVKWGGVLNLTNPYFIMNIKVINT